MPMKLTVKVGSDSIEAEGDFTIDQQVVELTKEWVKALPPTDQREAQAQIDALTARSKSQNDTLADTVAGHEIGSTPGNPGFAPTRGSESGTLLRAGRETGETS